MSFEKKIVYIGSDSKFYDDINKTSIKIINEENFTGIINISYPQKGWGEVFLQTIKESCPQLIYFDFSTLLPTAIEHFFSKWSFLYRLKEIKSIPLVGLFKNKEQLMENRSFLGYGMVYTSIKSKSVQTLFNDTFYIAYEESFAVAKFATVKDINLKQQLGLSSCVFSISLDQITLESDLNVKDDETLNINFNFFPEFKMNNFELLECNQSKFHKQLYSYNCQMPYATPWEIEEIGENTLDKQTVKVWIEENENKFIHILKSILIINDNLDFMLCMSTFIKDFKEIKIIGNNSITESIELTKSLNPNILLINLDDPKSPSKINTILLIEKLIENIKSILDYSPILFLFNSKSTSVAFQKIFNYQQIIALPQVMNTTECKKIIKMFNKKEININSESSFSFSTNVIEKYAEVLMEVTISSMTEHELVFYSKYELPYYCVLHLAIPVDIFLTIVPHNYDPPKELEGKAYRALINGVDQNDLETIRRFVNQAIRSPLQKFEYNIENSNKTSKLETISASVISTKKNNMNSKLETFKRKKIGKSKLE